MTQEDKHLLLQDLCARLPYGVKIYHIYSEKPVRFNSKHLNQIGEFKILPYLRSMSSMTEDEINEYLSECDKDNLDTLSAPHYHGTDWLNKKMFDYRGLIPMGLALEAPEEMYKKD